MGHKLINSNMNFLYYSAVYRCWPPNKQIYTEWNPSVFQGDKTIKDDTTMILGSKLQIWCDWGDFETEDQIAYGINNSLRVSSQVNWGSAKPDSTYESFLASIKKVGMVPGFVLPENPIPNNIAFRKKVSTSTMVPGSPAIGDSLVDSDYSTYWMSSESDTQWVCIDLESVYIIEHVKMNWDNNFPVSYKIQVSTDSANWETIYETDSSHAFVGHHYYLDSKGRFVRVLFLKSKKQSGYKIHELEVFGYVYDSNVVDENHDYYNAHVKCYPNPGNGIITIEHATSQFCHIELKIFNSMGIEVSALENSWFTPGVRKSYWNTAGLPSGVYFCRFRTDDKITFSKIVLER